MPSGKISLGQYMWTRIHQVGIDTIFGVPGDFNLQFLDSVFLVSGLKWVGNQNELNAAYAADGYARVKDVPGCFITTHGVGELSALNGVAGSMSEHVKIIHVVGQTTRAMQKNNMMIHHSIGRTPNHQVYNEASRGLRFAAAELWDVESAPKEIDRVIRECFLKSGPVYIFMPLDLSAEEVDVALLDTPIDVLPRVDGAAQDEAVKAIVAAIGEAKHPSVLVDALVQRFGAAEEAGQLVRKLNVPYFSTSMGKGVVDETEETYVGLWNGEISTPGVKEAAKAADLIITLGYIPADTNTASFSRKLADETTIHIDPHAVVVKGRTYPNTSIKPLLAALLSALPSTPQHKIPKPTLPPPRQPLDKDATHITQSHLWPTLSTFLHPNDLLVGETGTSNFGICDVAFPANMRYISQIYYGSIGWAFAATLGVEVARQETQSARGKGRTILCTGDGSMALTIQEIGTMIKAGSRAILFVINNEGYTVERLIWGARQPYNDIVPTSYQHLLPLYQHPSADASFHRATTKAELAAVLAKPALQDPQCLQLVELVVPKLDTSWRLGSVLAWRSDEAKQYLTDEGFVDTYGNWGLEGASGGDVKWS
ncbi:pyruvate decarboxylase-like protein [Dothidotthia symphoricarpi CBS 119687]|uniref:Pyruvate decarboxylase n=1 Tax=Dothidotthia symphoricarpi CBS 119687 TaxID=1392245 RepID=A0A6A6A588_9PLEO|nr:pyruvate decarboxylase-like protein [Dothidotthia symphoricarpi CBS 119687]KAF2125761.1 pyruvate decarboxylase-like protein [Dothidotthia symphoricarpi CBS 119687]